MTSPTTVVVRSSFLVTVFYMLGLDIDLFQQETAARAATSATGRPEPEGAVEEPADATTADRGTTATKRAKRVLMVEVPAY